MFGLLKIFFRFYNRFFSPDKTFAKRLRSLVGFTPSNLSIFKLAFYHKSASSEKLYAVQSNERLEYLGDAVLGTIVAEYLFKKYPNRDEGFLTKMRSKIVKRQSLNKIADKMGLDVFLSQYNNTRLSRSMLGNALEALVGAVYIECGYQKTRHYVIQKILRGYLDIHELESFDDNYKSQLLEWCQKNGQTVSYKMLAKYKFEKRDRFKVAVLIDGKKLAVADDFNKKSAEQTASEKAMQVLGLLTENKGEEKDDGQRKSRKPKNSRSPQNNRRDNRDNRGEQRKDNSRENSKENPRNKRSSRKNETANKNRNTQDNKEKEGAPKESKSVTNRSNEPKAKDNPRRKNTNDNGKAPNRKPNQNKERNERRNNKSSQSEGGKAPEKKVTSESVNKPVDVAPKEEVEIKNPRINSGRIQKKRKEEVKDVEEGMEQQEVVNSEAPEAKPPRAKNSRRSRGRRRNNQNNAPAEGGGQEEESVEIEIPVDLTKDIADNNNPVVVNPKTGPGEDVE